MSQVVILTELVPVKAKLNEVWKMLNESDNAIGVEKLIGNLYHE
ncbi:MAG: hypothetical protein ACM3SR_11150 [Ignavibacteriales bacterium]